MKHPKPRAAKSMRPVLVCDVHDFSKYGPQLGDRGPEFLQDMYWELTEVVLRHRGRVTKYLGDGLLAVFEEGAEKEAVTAALEMRRCFAELIADYRISVDSELETGIASGEVTIAELGHPSLTGTEIMGSTVFEAARIGDYRGVAITKRVYECVHDEVPTRRVADMKVKWRVEPMELWEVVES